MNINGGEREGNNLFHSFEEFSVPEGIEAVFKNAPDIENIFTRVTGDSASAINGILRTQGKANFFLVNPNGIIFGENASLDVGGSFIATTADKIKFSDGAEFIASEEAEPILTISVPIGLQFEGDNGAITVNGAGNEIISATSKTPTSVETSDQGLEVESGNTLALIGSGITVDGGTLTAENGNIELGSVGSDVVGIKQSETRFNFNYSDIDNYQDINLTNQALLNNDGEGSEAISLAGNNINFGNGSLALIQNRGASASGDINVTATESLSLTGPSSDGEAARSLRTEALGTGKGSNINVTTKKILTQEKAGFGTTAYDSAEGGDITINASDSVNILDGGGIGGFTRGSGKSGDVQLSTEELKVTGGGQVSSTTTGTGPGGAVNINSDIIELSGISDTGGTPSLIGTSTFRTGLPGDVSVNTSQLKLLDGGFLSSNSLSDGSTGNVTVNARESVEVNGKQGIYPSTIGSSVVVLSEDVRNRNQLPDEPSGLAGSTTVNSPLITVAQEGEISVKNEGSGNAGILSINAEELKLSDEGIITAESAFGEGGNINLNTDLLQLNETSSITATAENEGDGGNININTTSLIAKKNSEVTANAFSGDGGNITINAEGVFLFDSFENIFSASSDLGRGGEIRINTPDINLQKELEQSELEILTTEEIIANSCLANNNQKDSFTIGDSGGLPKSPDSNYSDVNFSLTGIGSFPTTTKQPTFNPENTQQPNQSMRPAQRMIKTPDGRIALSSCTSSGRVSLLSK